MRQFLTASLCLVIIFSGFGCGEKKGGNKASQRARSGVTGKVKPAAATAAGVDTASLSEKDKKIAEAAKTTNAKSCLEFAPKVTQPAEEKTLSGFSELVDGSEHEYVLSEATYYYASEDGTAYPGQIALQTKGFVNDTDASAKESANSNTQIICENSVTTDHVALEVTSNAILVNRFSTKDGSFVKLRQFGAKAIGSIAEVANRFAMAPNNVVDEEKNALALGITDENSGVVSKDPAGNGNVYWRVSTRKEAAGKKDVYDVTTLVAKYEKRPLTAATVASDAATLADAAKKAELSEAEAKAAEAKLALEKSEKEKADSEAKLKLELEAAKAEAAKAQAAATAAGATAAAK